MTSFTFLSCFFTFLFSFYPDLEEKKEPYWWLALLLKDQKMENEDRLIKISSLLLALAIQQPIISWVHQYICFVFPPLNVGISVLLLSYLWTSDVPDARHSFSLFGSNWESVISRHITTQQLYSGDFLALRALSLVLWSMPKLFSAT